MGARVCSVACFGAIGIQDYQFASPKDTQLLAAEDAVREA